jgi:hypothetical protein
MCDRASLLAPGCPSRAWYLAAKRQSLQEVLACIHTWLRAADAMTSVAHVSGCASALTQKVSNFRTLDDGSAHGE